MNYHNLYELYIEKLKLYKVYNYSFSVNKELYLENLKKIIELKAPLSKRIIYSFSPFEYLLDGFINDKKIFLKLKDEPIFGNIHIASAEGSYCDIENNKFKISLKLNHINELIFLVVVIFSFFFLIAELEFISKSNYLLALLGIPIFFLMNLLIKYLFHLNSLILKKELDYYFEKAYQMTKKTQTNS